MKTNLSVLVALSAMLMILGATPVSFAQTDPPPSVGYEDPFQLAADFAIKERGKLEKATITLDSIEKANVETSDAGLTFNLRLEVTVKKGSEETVKRDVSAVVYRDMDLVYSLKSWVINPPVPPFSAYEDPFQLAADFAVKERGKLEKATITLDSIEKANVETSDAGLTFNLRLEVTVKKGSEEAVKRDVSAVVYRDMDLVYSLKSWVISEKPAKQ